VLGAAQTLTLGGKLTTTPANLVRVSNTSPTAILGAALARYIDGPLERQLLPGIGSDGTSYQFPIGDATSYRLLNLSNVRTGTAPLVRATVYPSGATTPDNTTLQTLLSGRNWRLETLAGSLVSTTLELMEGGLPPTSLVGTATAQSGVYSSIGGSPMTGGVRSNPQAALSDRYFSIAGVPPNVYYYNETLLGDASLPTSWNSAPNGSGVAASAAQMTGGSTTAFIVRSGITARANAGLTFGTASTLTIQGSGTLVIQSGTFTNGANTSVLGTLHIGDGALWNNLSSASIGANGVLRLEGAASLSGNLPVFTATSSALEYTGTTPKTAGTEWASSVPFRVRIANSGGVQLSANKTLTNTAQLTVQASGALILASGVSITNDGTFTVDNGGRLTLDGTASVAGANDVQYSVGGTLAFTKTVAAANVNAGQRAFPQTMNGNVLVQNSITLVQDKTVNGSWTGGLSAETVTMGANTLALNGAIDFGNVALQSSPASRLNIGGSGGITGNAAFPSGQIDQMQMNRAGAVLPLATSLNVQSSLTLMNGVIRSTSGLLSLVNPAVSALVGGSAGSYVDGAFARGLAANMSADAARYLFPIGKAGQYSPLALTNLTTGAAPPIVRAEAFTSAAAGTLAMGVSGTLSLTEHWQTQVLSGNYVSGAAVLTRNGLSATSLVGFALEPTTVFQNAGSTVSGNTIQSSTVSGLGMFSVVFSGVMQIADFTPKIAPVGATITITGTGFASISRVTLGGVTASSMTVVSPTQITVQVPVGAISGALSVTRTTPAETVVADSLFTLLPPPVIASFSPSGGAVGSTVNIVGANFAGMTQVRMNGVVVPSFTVISPTQIRTTVPAGGYGLLEVVGIAGTATSATVFGSATSPTITDFTPTAAKESATVTINGTNFTGATAVRFGGVDALSFSIVSPTRILATVGAGTTGTVSVVTPSGTAVSAGVFRHGILPVITSFSPRSAAPGGWIRAIGQNLDGLLSVEVNSTPSDSIRQISPDIIEFKIPLSVVRSQEWLWSSDFVRARVFNGIASGSIRVLELPKVTSVKPDSGRSGDTIRIWVNDLYDATAVTIGGVPVRIASVSRANFVVAVDEILVVVPSSIPYNSQFVVVYGNGVATTPERWFHIPPRPTVTAQSLDSGEIGETVRLTGTNFFSDTKIFFNGVEAASVIVHSTTSVSAVVPRSASSGLITLSTQYGVAAAPRTFTVILNSPRITAFSPNQGGAGALVRITGVRFDSTVAITFGGIAARTFISGTTDIVAVVPSGVTLGDVVLSVSSQFGATQAAQRFRILPAPILTNIDPIAEGYGERITVSGRNFTTVTTLTVGGVAVVNLSILSDSVMIFTADRLPVGSGTVTAFSPGGQGSYSVPFEVLSPSVANAPRNLSFSPTFGPTGTRIRITGRNLGNILAARIGSASVAAVEQISTTEVIVVVGRGATGAIVLTNTFGTGSSRAAFRYQTQLELDSIAVVGFYEAHRAENAVVPRLWRTLSRIVQWEGVTVQSVNDNGFAEERITGLNLSGKALNGRMTNGRLRMQDIARLTALRTLNLSNNALSGDIALQFAAYRRLQELRLAGNRLSGELGQIFGTQDFPASLEALDVRSNTLTGTLSPMLFALPNLRELLLAQNRFTGAFALRQSSTQIAGEIQGKSASLTNSSVLEQLDLSGNNLTGALPTEIGKLSRLQVLRLSNNAFSGALPAQIGECNHLEVLDVRNNQFSSALPEEIKNCSRLEALLLTNNRLTSIPDLSVLRRRLEVLDVGNNRLDFASLEPNMVLDTIRYIPQDSIEMQQRSVIGIVGQTLRIQLAVGGSFNRRSWDMNGVSIGTLPASFRLTDTGVYVCRVTNTRVPGLTLVSRPVSVSGRLPNPPNAAPRLVLPLHNATGLPADTATIEWTSVAEAAEYEVQFSATQDFTTPVRTFSVNTTASVVTDLDNLSRYFWRVRATNAGGVGAWSEIRSFVTVRLGAIVSVTAESFEKTAIGDERFGRMNFRNLTGRRIVIDSLKFIEPENSYATRTAFRSLTLEGREQRTVVTAFTPKTSGQKIGSVEAVLTIVSTQSQERENFSNLLLGAGTALKALPVAYDTVIAGKTTILPALLINRGQTALEISSLRYVGSTNGLVSGVFSFQGAGNKSLQEEPIKRGEKITLQSGDTLTVVTRCEPTSVGEKRAQLQWQTIGAGADTAETEVSAFVKPPEPADVVVKFGIRPVDAQGKPLPKAAPGSSVLLELYIAEGNLDSLVNVAQPEFTASLRYDRNVLSVTAEEGFARVVRSNANSRYQRLQLTGGRWSGRGQRLALVRCRAVAGDTTATALEIESSAWGGLAATGQRAFWERRVFMLAPENGLFETNVSRAGGLRLIAPAKTALAIVGIAPNPAKETLEVSYLLAESSMVEVSLINARGETVQVLKREVQAAGEHSVQGLVERLPSGSYTVQVRANGEVATRGVQVVR
jgi:hypothetical protein